MTVIRTGGYNEGDNSQPIKVFPEQLEKDISNIIARCSEKVIMKDGPIWAIGDLSILTIELMEYILDEKRKPI